MQCMRMTLKSPSLNFYNKDCCDLCKHERNTIRTYTYVDIILGTFIGYIATYVYIRAQYKNTIICGCTKEIPSSYF